MIPFAKLIMLINNAITHFSYSVVLSGFEALLEFLASALRFAQLSDGLLTGVGLVPPVSRRRRRVCKSRTLCPEPICLCAHLCQLRLHLLQPVSLLRTRGGGRGRRIRSFQTIIIRHPIHALLLVLLTATNYDDLVTISTPDIISYDLNPGLKRNKNIQTTRKS